MLFIDGRKLGTLIPASRKQKELSANEIERIESCYRAFRRHQAPDTIPGFVRAVPVEEIRKYGYALASGRYVGTAADEDDGDPFEYRMQKLVAQLRRQQDQAAHLDTAINACLRELGYGE